MAKALTVVPHLQHLMHDPAKGVSLGQLKEELNLIAAIRHGARLAFCKRLAVAYLLVVGHRPSRQHGESGKFMKWCGENLRSATGKRYSSGTIAGYLTVGFARDPEKHIAEERKRAEQRRQATVALVHRMEKSVSSTARVQLLESYRRGRRNLAPTSGDVADEVNRGMTWWDNASPAARAQFLYMVAGVRIAV